jgi:signal transduction histidine kinase
MFAIPSAEDLFWYVAQNVMGRLNFVDCVIYRADESSGILRQVAAWGAKNPTGREILNPLVIPFGSGITGLAAQNRTAQVVDDLLEHRDYIPDLHPARSEICIPLVCEGRVIGVIDSEHPEPKAFGALELEIMTTLATMTAARLARIEQEQESTRRYHDLAASHARLTRELELRKSRESSLHDARHTESLGRLTGRLAHEFNNIMTVISGNLEFLEPEITGPEARTFLGDATAAASRATGLMKDMLGYAGKTRLAPEILDLAALVDQVCRSLGNGLACQVEGPPGTVVWPVSADRRAVETILRNLVANAREATEAGGAVRIGIANVLLAPSPDALPGTDLPPGRYVHLTVTDTGTGIPPDRLPHIFDPFFTTKPPATARGLGLSVVHGLMRQLGGAVTVRSDPGKGSAFTVALPALSGDPGTPPLHPPS